MSGSRRKTILLVEDEVILSMLWKKNLEKYDYAVRTSSSGEKAVALIDDDQSIDLVLMDIDLGRGKDGIAAAEEILALRDVPIVFVSCHTEPEIIQKTELVTATATL